MTVIHWLLAGLVAAMLAHLAIGKRRYGLVGDLALGSIGGVSCGWLFEHAGLSQDVSDGVHIAVATIGALGVVVGIHVLLRATERAVAMAGAALNAGSLESTLPKLSDLERRVIGKFIHRERAARDPKVVLERGLSFGARAADKLATFGGSWTFLGLFAAVMMTWMAFNIERPGSFDPYPFILLNLVLSCLAAVQAPIILMSQNRQADNDRIHSRLDYEVNLKSEMEIMALHEKIDALRASQSELLERLVGAPPRGDVRPDP